MVTATESVRIGAELPERISTLLLDLDGTLVDTTYFHTVAWFLACDELGEHRPMAAIHPLIGMGGPELMHELLGRSSESLGAAHDRIFSEYLASVRPLPGAPELVAFGATRGLHVCVVTSSGDEVVDSLMAPLGGVGAVDDVVHAGMAERTKPHPDLFQVALERVRVPPSEALAVGDAVWDVRSAASAGVACVGLESGGTARAALIHAGAVDVYRDARQMLHEWRGNPGEAPGTGE